MRKYWIIVMAAAVALACVCPATSGITGTLEAMQGTIGVALTEAPAMLTELSTSMATGPTGIIRGTLNSPAGAVPAQRVVAFDTTTMKMAADAITEVGQTTYEITVAPGDYFVVAYLQDGSLSAGYSQAVKCGLKPACKDHSLIPVHVTDGGVVENIDPQDWNAPRGTFPPIPPSAP